MKAYLEKWNGEWLDDFVYQSIFPIKDRRISLVPFNGEKLNDFIKNTKFEKSDILIGSVESTSAFFEAIGLNEPNYIGYPNSIKKYLKRNIRETSLENCNEWNYPYFIKPANKVKKFTGSLVENNNQFEILHRYMGIELNTEVLSN